jgi:hypothetical protein
MLDALDTRLELTPNSKRKAVDAAIKKGALLAKRLSGAEMREKAASVDSSLVRGPDPCGCKKRFPVAMPSFNVG